MGNLIADWSQAGISYTTQYYYHPVKPRQLGYLLMPTCLGLDIGTNSVGSAWIETDSKLIRLGVSIFPAGVEESDRKRGVPVNQQRRQKRSVRRILARRSKRKFRLRKALITAGLLPSDEQLLDAMFYPRTPEDAVKWDPWNLRRAGLKRELTPYEFGRVLVHLGQRRGAFGVTVEQEDDDEDAAAVLEAQTVKNAIRNLADKMNAAGAQTFGQFMADEIERRRQPLAHHPERYFCEPVRNRQYRLPHSEQLHADRSVIRAEFERLWNAQIAHQGELATLLTKELLKLLDDPSGNKTWRNKGLLFGQRRTYWDTGTLGRCDLEPTDHRCPIADMYAQQFRVLETVNNLRIKKRGEEWLPLAADQRAKVIAALRKTKSASIATVRTALGINKKEIKAFYTLNLEEDPNRDINTDWFYREVVHGVFTEPTWNALSDQKREAVNTAILRFDASKPDSKLRLISGAQSWWGLTAAQAEALASAALMRPNLEKRVRLSRKALKNLLPIMQAPNPRDPSYSRHQHCETALRRRANEWCDAPTTSSIRLHSD